MIHKVNQGTRFKKATVNKRETPKTFKTKGNVVPERHNDNEVKQTVSKYKFKLILKENNSGCDQQTFHIDYSS